MPVTLDYDATGEPVMQTCQGCGSTSTFDATLPFVNQMASFITGHECWYVIVLPDVTSV